MNELVTYANDIAAFGEDVLGLTKGFHEGQKEFFKLLQARRHPNRWVALYLTIMLAAGNRAGKTLALAVYIIHSCTFKTNLDSVWPPMTQDKFKKKWAKAEYHWYHFGISHEVADLVYKDITKILAGNHPAQDADLGCPLTKNGPVATWDVKEYGDYRWVQFVNGSQVHFRTTSEKALGQLGTDMHGITFDEAGIEPRLDFLVDEVFDFRRLGTGGQLVLASTPSEDIGTMFADRWATGDPDNPKRTSSHISMRMSSQLNIGFGLTQEMFDILTAGFDDRKWKQNVLGIFVQSKAAYFNADNVDLAFYEELPERSPARPLMVYLQGVDPAKQKDSAWSVVLAVVPDPKDPENPYLVGVRAEQKVGQKQTSTIVALASDGYYAYERLHKPGRGEGNMKPSRCYTAIDATGFGGKMFREALDAEVPQVFNVEFGGTVQKKRKLLGDLRTVIDSGRLLLPRTGIWLIVRKQLLGYKLEDRGIEQDAVMALVCAVWLVKRAPADGETSIPFDLSGAA